MGDEFDTSVDTSFEDTSSDFSDSGGFDDSLDVGGYMDSPSDVGDVSDAYTDVGSLMDEPSDIGSIMDEPALSDDFSEPISDVGDISDTSSDIGSLMVESGDLGDVMSEPTDFVDQQTDVENIADTPSDIGSLMDESSDIGSAMDNMDDVEPYQATPNSDIPILQEDGSVDSLENIMAANEDTGGAPMDVEPYHATPNSEIQILQEDGTVDTLENIMAANADADDSSMDVEPYQATPNSEIPILQEDGTVDSLENIMAANAEAEGAELDGDSFDIASPDVTDDEEPGSLDAIMSENAENDSGELEQIGFDAVPMADAADTPQSDITSVEEGTDTAGDDATDVGDIADPVGEPIHMTQSDVEWYMENANDPESLRQMRDGIASGRIQVDADTELPSDDAIDEASGPVLTRDPNEQWEIGNNAIDNTVEAMRDDLRDKGMEDGPEMEAIVMAERARMQDELTRNINGDFSDPYQKPDFTELMQSDMTDVPAQDIPNVEQAADTVEATDMVADVPQDIDYDAVYSGLDSYDFDGIDYSSDVDRLDSSLENFQNGTWENLSVDEQKAAMSDLADYVKDVIGFDNPPQIVYYNNPVDGDYGGYSPSTNTLEVNEHMLYDNNEAADTIAHELWHAYQHERAMNPQSAKDYQYQYGFENYIRPDDDFTAYQDQLVEAEARAFAQQFKDRLSTKRRSI